MQIQSQRTWARRIPHNNIVQIDNNLAERWIGGAPPDKECIDGIVAMTYLLQLQRR